MKFIAAAALAASLLLPLGQSHAGQVDDAFKAIYSQEYAWRSGKAAGPRQLVIAARTLSRFPSRSAPGNPRRRSLLRSGNRAFGEILA